MSSVRRMGYGFCGKDHPRHQPAIGAHFSSNSMQDWKKSTLVNVLLIGLKSRSIVATAADHTPSNDPSSGIRHPAVEAADVGRKQL